MPGVIIRQNLCVSDRLSYFTTQWTDHTRARDAGIFTDLTFVSKASQKVHVHSSVLLPFFPFLSHLARAVQGPQVEVLLPGVELVTVRQMVDLIYTGNCDISSPLQVGEILGLMTSLGLDMPPNRLEMKKREEVAVLADIDTNMNLPTIQVVKVEQSDDIEAGENNTFECIKGEKKGGLEIKKIESSQNSANKVGGLHSCSLCPRMFRFSHTLKMHQLVHSVARPVSCPSCPQTFKKSHHLARHIKHRHSGEGPGVGGTGVKALSSVCDSEERKFTCPLCGFHGQSPKQLSLHLKSHQMSYEDVQYHGTVKKGGKPGRQRKLTFDTPSVNCVTEKSKGEKHAIAKSKCHTLRGKIVHIDHGDIANETIEDLGERDIRSVKPCGKVALKLELQDERVVRGTIPAKAVNIEQGD